MSAREQAGALWERAVMALRIARHDLPLSPDAAAARAYYAAFHAVSALFALRGREFRKHSALEAAVHRDLVKPGLWPNAVGEKYSALARLRSISDYGAAQHIPSAEAEAALASARAVLEAVSQLHPDVFPPSAK